MFTGPDVEELALDTGVYSVDAIMRACYWLTDRAYIFIDSGPGEKYTVRLAAKYPDVNSKTLVGELANSLLDFQLRVNINAETNLIRSLIVGKAFAAGGFDDEPPGDYRDPVNSGRAWEDIAPR